MGSNAAKFIVAVRPVFSSSIKHRREFNVRTEVRPDLICIPPVIRLNAVGVRDSTLAEIEVDHVVVAEDNDAKTIHAFIESQEDVSPVVVDSIERLRSEKQPKSDLMKISYCVKLRLVSESRVNRNNKPLSLRGPMSMKVQVRRSNEALIEEVVPILLPAPEEI